MKETSFALYLDESGNELLYSMEEYLQNPELETHCTLMGVIIDHNKKDLLKKELSELKKYFRWYSNEVILHNTEIRNKTGAFAIFHYRPELYEQFKERMNNITKIVEPVIICSSLNKKLWVERYPKKLFFKDDPYELAFVYLLERYAHFLNNQSFDSVRGHIIAEARTPKKDRSLNEIYKRVRQYGTQYHPNTFFSKIYDNKISFFHKDLNIPGMQLSDYFCYSFYVNHKYPERQNEHYKFLETFIYPGEYGQYGYKKWPV